MMILCLIVPFMLLIGVFVVDIIKTIKYTKQVKRKKELKAFEESRQIQDQIILQELFPIFKEFFDKTSKDYWWTYRERLRYYVQNSYIMLTYPGFREHLTKHNLKNLVDLINNTSIV